MEQLPGRRSADQLPSMPPRNNGAKTVVRSSVEGLWQHHSGDFVFLSVRVLRVLRTKPCSLAVGMTDVPLLHLLHL